MPIRSIIFMPTRFRSTWQGRDYLFFEDLDHKTGKGVIAAVAFDEAGRPGPTVPVLEEPWHLSYPFLIERGGEIFMIPESSANRDIALYRAVEFPLKWERHAVLVDDVEAADATIVEHDGLLWMFAVVRDGVGGYSDTLAIWWSTDLLGPWRPHPENPVLVDDRTARPAGNMVRRNGALYRPVQDCRRAYGGALGFMKVTRLDREGFAQESEGTISGGAVLARQAAAHAELQWPPRSDRRFYAAPEVQIRWPILSIAGTSRKPDALVILPVAPARP